jgi:hypothetical protein
MGHIDYLSLDTEGGELDILKSIDYRRFPVNCISVENKYEEKEIYRFLSSVGYRKIARLKIDDIFVLKNSPFDCYREPWGQKINHHILNWKKIVKKIIGYD